MTEHELLKDCLQRLAAAEIPYMLVGSMASNFWGVPRSTHDIDFVVQYTHAEAVRIVKAFEDNFFIQSISVEAALRPPFQFNALDNRSALKVDFFTVGPDEYDQLRFERRLPVTLLGQAAFIARPEDVILYKLRWFQITPSDRQLTDIAGILDVSNSAIDHVYMAEWANKLEVFNVLKPLLDQRKQL